jgi:Flp pilus assembly protein TadG
MDAYSIARRIRQTWRRYCAERSGNVIVIFGLAVLPLVGLAGAAVDYSRANAARTDMQMAMDATGLMLSKYIQGGGSTDESTLSTKADQYFRELFKKPCGQQQAEMSCTDATIDSVHAVYGSSARGRTVTTTVAGHIVAKFMPVLGTGIHNMSFGSNSVVTWGPKIRVALALDTTGSMADPTTGTSKIQALKDAIAGSGGLIETLRPLDQTADDVYMSIVPFAMHVTSPDTLSDGTNAYTHDEWIDWTDWEAAPPLPANGYKYGPGWSCPWTSGTDGFGCKNLSSGTSGTIQTSGSYTGYICPNTMTTSHNPRRSRPWNGCYCSKYNSSQPTTVIATGSTASCGSRPNCSCTGSGSSKTCSQGGYDHFWRPTSAQCASPPSDAAPDHSTWKTTYHNYIMDRGPSLYVPWGSSPPGTTAYHDEDISAPVAGAGSEATRFPADGYTGTCQDGTSPCPAPMRALNNDWGDATTGMIKYVNGLKPGGGTNQNIGLVWAWQSLVGGGPLTAKPKTVGDLYEEYIILLSDGMNTGDRWYCDGQQDCPSTDIDSRQSTTCQNIRATSTAAHPITIYTILVNTDGALESTLLQNCATRPNATATDPATYFHITTASGIGSAFRAIAQDILRTHLTH